jgi:hypothetical protein
MDSNPDDGWIDGSMDRWMDGWMNRWNGTELKVNRNTGLSIND